MKGFDLPSEIEQQDINEAFLSAYLLTESAATAEQTVCSAIESLETSQLDGRTLIARTLSLCATQSRNAIFADAVCPKPLSLPAELQAVMELEPAVRRCFIARVLLEFSLHDCVGLLQTDAVTITRCLIEATRLLCLRFNKSSNESRFHHRQKCGAPPATKRSATPGPAVAAVTYSFYLFIGQKAE